MRMFRNAATGMTFTFGPTLRAKAGETIRIRIANNLTKAPNESWVEAPSIGFRLPGWLGLYAHGLHIGMYLPLWYVSQSDSDLIPMFYVGCINCHACSVNNNASFVKQYKLSQDRDILNESVFTQKIEFLLQ
jgi:hypothetical protein